MLPWLCPLPLNTPFTYRVPPELTSFAETGRRALVPFGPRLLTGFILGVSENPGDLAPERIVHLDYIIQHILGIPILESFPNLVDHKPGGFVMDFKKSFQQGSGTSPFVRSHQIDGPESLIKRKMGMMEHSIRGKRSLEPTVSH